VSARVRDHPAVRSPDGLRGRPHPESQAAGDHATDRLRRRYPLCA